MSLRFYNYTIKGICPNVPTGDKLHGFTDLMKKHVTRVMLFSLQGSFYTLSPETDYKWIGTPLAVVESGVEDYASCPAAWPKNCQISPTEWLFFGGMNPGATHDDVGFTGVLHLDTSTHRLKKLTEIPYGSKSLAH